MNLLENKNNVQNKNDRNILAKTYTSNDIGNLY